MRISPVDHLGRRTVREDPGRTVVGHYLISHWYIVIYKYIRDPAPDYAKIAQGYGVYAEGPISDPNALAPALERALARVRAGEPALLDVVSQPR